MNGEIKNPIFKIKNKAQINHLVVGGLFTNCYLLVSGGELLIIDPGGEADRILSEIKKIKATPKYIINTHSHFDHTLANKDIKEATGIEILTNLKEGDKIKIGELQLTVISTPGHTKDSICLLNDDLIFTGDTLFRDGYGRTDLPSGSQEDMDASLKRISSILKQGMYVCPGHDETFYV